MADVMRRALEEGWTTARFAQALADQQARQAA
jgi:hypothetical protein